MMKLSGTEKMIIEILGRKTMKIGEIADKIYGNKKPEFGNMVISNAVNRINQKCEEHKAGWHLEGWNFGRSGKLIKRVWTAKVPKHPVDLER